MKRKWWILVVGLVPVLLLSLCFFGVRVRIVPRLVLSRAVGNAVEQLEERFEDSPALLIADALDPMGRQQASVLLETEQDLLGVVRYDMQLHTQLSPCRVQAEGTVVTGGKMLDLSMYLDGDFAAVSSDNLVGGSFYGITYDTFPEDIRSRQILAALIGDKTISQWEQSVSDLDTAMSRDLKLPEITKEDIISALYGIMALKPQVSRVETPAGAAPYAYAVTFRVSAQEISRITDSYTDQIPAELTSRLEDLKKDPNGVITVEFLLSKGKLVQVEAELNTAAENTQIAVVLGENPETSKLYVEMTAQAGENSRKLWLEIETVSDEETYQEKLSIIQIRDQVRNKISLDYAFDLSTGEMDLTILRNEKEAQVQLNLAGEGDALTIISQNVAPILNLFLKKPLNSPAICTLTVSPGGEVAVPTYRNLDQWSLEDLLELLSGLGGLLGLKI